MSSAIDRAGGLADGRLLLDEPVEHVVRLTINNPEKRNALDQTILDAIAQAVPSLDARCLLLTGAGDTFSAGYDIGGMPDETFADEAEKLVAHPFADAIAALDAYPYPTVAALNGHAIGGGLEVALSCDLRVAAAGALVGMPPAKLGLVYSHTGLEKFIDAIGVPRTRELFLVNAVHPADELPGAALDLASEIAGNAPLALSGNKTVIRRLLESRGALDPDVEHELVELRRACFTSEDFREGVRAFAEKRRPEWRGR